MEPLDLIGAAHFLRMHPETLRRRASRREIPGVRAGRAWVFLDLDLLATNRTVRFSST